MLVHQRVINWTIFQPRGPIVCELSTALDVHIPLKNGFGVKLKTSISTWDPLTQTHDGSMVLQYMVCHGSHQYTPFMLVYIPAPWICHGKHIMINVFYSFGGISLHRSFGGLPLLVLRAAEDLSCSSRSAVGRYSVWFHSESASKYFQAWFVHHTCMYTMKPMKLYSCRTPSRINDHFRNLNWRRHLNKAHFSGPFFTEYPHNIWPYVN